MVENCEDFSYTVGSRKYIATVAYLNFKKGLLLKKEYLASKSAGLWKADPFRKNDLKFFEGLGFGAFNEKRSQLWRTSE